MKFHFPFAAGGAVSAPTAASTAADGGMIDVTAGKNEEDGDHRHHSIDRGIHGYLLFMSLLIFRNNKKRRGLLFGCGSEGEAYACAAAPSAAGFSFGAGRQMK